MQQIKYNTLRILVYRDSVVSFHWLLILSFGPGDAHSIEDILVHLLLTPFFEINIIRKTVMMIS